MPPSFSEVPSITLRISNETPVSAHSYAELLSALAADYEKASGGRKLVITRIEEGSILATLQDYFAWSAPHLKDLAAIATAANSLKGLYLSIAGLLSKAKQNASLSGREKAFKSVEKMVKLGVESGGNTEVSYKSKDGDELKVTITQVEARELSRNFERARPKPKRRADYDLSDESEPNSPSVLLRKLEVLPSISATASQRDHPATNEIKQLLGALAAVGLLDMVVLLSRELVQRGRPDLSALLRELANEFR